MDQRIIYQTDDGGVAILVPCDCGLTIEEIAAKDVPAGKPYTIVDVADISPDRTFRNAWEVDKGAIKTSVSKARDIAHKMRRMKRSDEFKPLDIDATIPDRAIGAEAKRADVRTKYDALQIVIDAAKDVDELLAAVAAIKGPPDAV